eukprot:CAMPEP_0117560028 /NCGR_PEP_ID=MMETSP0784-20121206/53664_1 /TAXON_ID=39447 /ORGANISM="" /LENGTH=723 /DNA_ID=CAMNT_0005357423 /DNA_START=113 /DNA_END=2284 /DNA_ORIENTATION=+
MVSITAASLMPFALVATMLAVCRADFSGSSRSVARVTPMEKVVRLLEDLKAEVQGDGAKEANTYEAFACFCKTTTASKSQAIKSGHDTIDIKSSTIEEKTANKATTLSELSRRQADQESFGADLKATEVRCASEKATYEATDADLTKAISSLEGAIESLSGAKPASLIAVRASVERCLALADGLNIMAAQKRDAARALLQHTVGVDPLDAEYKFHSQGILDTVSELKQQFEAEKATVDSEWVKTNQACIDTKASLAFQMSSNTRGIATCKTTIDSLKADIARAKEELVGAEAALKDDQNYLRDLTERCEARAKDWDQRSQLRADELKALTEALTILQQGVAPEDVAVNKRALLLGRSHLEHSFAGFAPSFLQLRASGAGADATSRAGRNVAVVRSSSVSADSLARARRAAALLRDESRRLGSVALASMASSASADPFAKVKDLIQQLVERLIRESTAEATKKRFCDTEIAKAEKDRGFRLADVEALNVKIAGLEAKEDKLQEDIDALTVALGDLRKNLANATSIRADEKVDNIATVQQAKEGLAALNEAIGILKVFYKQAAKAKMSLLQASPVDDDTQGAGFAGAYKGKQEASAGIIGLLEVIRSDFERTIKTTEASEEQAAAGFVEFDRVSKTDISGKETQKTLNEEDLEATKNEIQQATTDLQTGMNLLDDALKTLEDLRPTCIDLTMPYAERVQKREDEIAALKRALCILDTERVESECQ